MASTQQLLLGEGAGGAEKNYIEDVFSTYLYTGNGSTQTITNNIDLSTEGGLVWTKIRSSANDHILVDTVRGTSAGYLTTDAAYAQSGSTYGVTAFNTNGYALNSAGAVNSSSSTYASWTFRKQPKFFDIQTYTGSASAVTINHNLGSSPGCVIIKCTDTARNWMVWHRSLTNSQYMYLNTTDAVGSLSNWISVSSTQITIQPNASGNPDANYVGRNYIAYIFAHDAGGFGLTGTDNVISCGSYTDGALTSVNLGWEPQWLLVKPSSSSGSWVLVDTMRNMSMTNTSYVLAESSAAEASFGSSYFQPTPTGFYIPQALYGTGTTMIYIAIRRGPMKVPTDATKVFKPSYGLNGGANGKVWDAGFPTDMYIRDNPASSNFYTSDRLRGSSNYLLTNTTGAEASIAYSDKLDNNVGVYSTNAYDYTTWIAWMFKRAPSFFDVVCYRGTGSSLVVNHNLGVAPELVIFKGRNTAGTYWGVYASALPNKYLYLNLTNAAASGFSYLSASSSTTMTLNGDSDTNQSGRTQVAYLFATCAGVSKVGNYTGTGTTKQIDCGFAAGARFVLVKATSTTGNWIVVDTARGLVSGNDPTLLLNSTAAEVTTNDWFDPYSAGFELSNAAGNLANTSGTEYIYFAVA